VADGGVVRGPQGRVGRDGDEEGPAGLENAPHLLDRAEVVLDVLEDVEGDDEVHRVGV